MNESGIPTSGVTTLVPYRSWSELQAYGFITYIREPLLKHGFAVGLTGSCLWYHHSKKDLDLIVYPLVNPANESREDRIRKINDALTGLGLEMVATVEDVKVFREHLRMDADDKDVAVWSYEGKRVDVFYLR